MSFYSNFVKLIMKYVTCYAESSFPHNYLLALYHSQQIKGDAVYEIDPAKDIEASEAYPDVTYTTADEYLNQFV
jgi:phenylcoumaran benzylic ether reductase